MNRRGFLFGLAAGFGLALDPERLLWRPGAKLISIPPCSHKISDTLALFTPNALKPGDIITLQGVYANYPRYERFTIRAVYESAGEVRIDAMKDRYERQFPAVVSF